MEFHIRLTERQLDRISEILGNLGLLLLATTVLPILTSSISFSVLTIISGLFATVICIYISIFIEGGVMYE